MIRMHFVVAWLLCLCAAVADAGCQRQCGSVAVPYPFGISNVGGGDGCFRGPAFNLTCNDSFQPPRPFWGRLEVINISVLQAEMTIGAKISVDCYNSSISANKSANSFGYVNLYADRPFTFSQRNLFTTIGCDHVSLLRGHWGHETINACGTVCSNVSSQLIDGACDGVGCCQVPIPKGVKNFNIDLRRYSDDTFSSYPCGFAFIVDQDQFQFKTSMLTNYSFYLHSNGTVPVVLDRFRTQMTTRAGDRIPSASTPRLSLGISAPAKMDLLETLTRDAVMSMSVLIRPRTTANMPVIMNRDHTGALALVAWLVMGEEMDQVANFQWFNLLWVLTRLS